MEQTVSLPPPPHRSSVINGVRGWWFGVVLPNKNRLRTIQLYALTVVHGHTDWGERVLGNVVIN